ncbi:MAG: hypothetical protein GC168_13970 [Candidatus Hydrogenedens sp.]|nr:hypothetical protein [Candidatus Hydrogenedens sp.]
MKTGFGALVSVMIAAFAAAGAHAEIKISLEIEGTVGEIMQVLRTLKDAGLGGEPGRPEEGMKLEVHSSASPEGEAPAEMPVPEAPPAPALAFHELTVEPGVVRAGEVVHVRVRLSDPDMRVDTVEATLTHGDQSFAFDLFDNASHGDATANDGLWSVDALMPQASDVGEFTLVLRAYDSLGAPVTVNVNGAAEPVSATAQLSVQP